MFYNIDNWHHKNIEIQKNILLKQAQTDFNNRVNTRKWDSQSDFEIRALKNLEKTHNSEYYEFSDDDKFLYVGALTTKGGISVTLNSNEYHEIIKSITDQVYFAKISLFLFLSIITLLIHKQFNSNIDLLKNVKLRTKEIEKTKKLLQNILDADKSFLLVSDGKDIIFANKTALDIAGFSSLTDFEDENKHISDKFERVDNPDFLQFDNNGLHWIPYLQKEQNHRDLKVLIKKDGEKKYLKPHSKEISVDNRLLHLITFDDITDDHIKIKDLTTEASTDPLTGLFNRRKLNGVLSKEIELSSVAKSPLSIIFLDIDHFKSVNDTFGHDVGDEVLIDLSKIITSTTRKGDFIARWGGEEFMIALQATNDSAASHLAEKLRVAVEAYSFNIVGNITISFGVTQYIYGEHKNNFTKRVDKALYEAKDSGKNRVVIK
ncbi:MAG: GGDEF domain-containing protein [Sulfurimonas sp.]|nr:GGDEF domain-containing protein [Sulfurimonas sp.]